MFQFWSRLIALVVCSVCVIVNAGWFWQKKPVPPKKRAIYAVKKYTNRARFKSKKKKGRRKQPKRGSLTAQALAAYPNKLPRVNWRHILMPEMSRGKVTGYHYRGNYLKNRVIPQPKIIHKRRLKNRHGGYQATFVHKGQKKRSSFFPDSWSLAKLKKKMREAYTNRVSYQGNQGFTGRTKDGMDMQFWFTRGKGGQIILNSVYPRL